MKNPFFVDQETMEALITAGKTKLQGTSFTVTETGKSYTLTPAVKVLSCESSDKDPLRISDKYIPLSILESAGVDISVSSIILHNHAYHIDPGYICDSCDDAG